ncbi:ammonium transporter, Amt family [Algoriphagus alkaliphilus]|uniref:Ammonium transporter n=1 Tax=Algoriphagus alkaliphilus TaxID=279824 RepID=A0A1G5WM17_9BACT|nr:ammonium transporter [Algoriphagus alkaliphilus]MBA4300583.1 ammonium transporter [Cyclobacterium sp.]SDA59231.1 ammonium transporter, Amt family [Algoriphagus alkaliphilus]
MQEPVQDLFTVNNLWMMIATILVFIMHLGFATLEAGLTRSKNTVNILFKNTIIPAIGILTYALIGFNLMYPGADFAGSFFGFGGLGLSLPEGWDSSNYNAGYTYFTDFIFQAMFAATAATIVSGAVAERVKLGPFITFSILYVAFIYPIVGMWKWGGGFLSTLETPFYDFAGSTIVHSVGGWGALVGAYLLGPRIGKYTAQGMKAIPGHNIPMATIGVFLLWFGWFGFNGGSVLSASPGLVSRVFVTTSLAAAAGAFGALIVSYIKFKTYDITMVLNGILAGLVGITAGADQMGILDSVIIGFVGGGLVVFGVVLFDKIKIDDPVGAISVHLVGGIWGTLAVGLFGDLAGMSQVISQLIGIGSTAVFCFGTAWLIFFTLKKTIGIRVDEKEEVEGLDINEHSMRAYPDFMTKD